MKKKKRYIVILAALGVYVVIMLLVLGKDLLIPSKDKLTLIVGDETIWTLENDSWTNVTNSSTIASLNWKSYKVYLDNKAFGKYYLWKNDNKWYVFDKNKKAVSTDGNILAYDANYDIKVKNFSTKNIRNYYHVEKMLEKNNLSPSSKYTVATETSLDIDNDGANETFYFVSNAFSLDYNPNKIFSFVFMVKNSKIYPMYTDIAPNMTNNGCKPYLSAVIDMDKDNKYEMIISCGKYSTDKPADMLYKLTDQGFKIIISNQ